jgi:hypothetical protein
MDAQWLILHGTDWKHDFVEIFGRTLLIPRDGVEESANDSSGMRDAEWDIARMVLLPKNGDLSLCKNWRGICLLDIASKTFSSMCVRRLKTVMEEEGLDEQSGFRANRGTIDSLFTASIGLQKRKEDNLETWVLLVDLEMRYLQCYDVTDYQTIF